MATTLGCQDIGTDPSPEEIRAMCLEIQETWSPEEERRRRLCPHMENQATLLENCPELVAPAFRVVGTGSSAHWEKMEPPE